MKILSRSAVVAVLFPLLAWPVSAQVDLQGPWDLQASGVISQQPTLKGSTQGDRGILVEPCEFEGGGDLTQNGDQVTGQATLTLVSGPETCPSEMMADVMGTVEGNSFFGMLDGGQMFGGLNFTGTLSQDGLSIQGTYEVKPEGPFSNVTDGSWAASAAAQSVLEIPVLGPAGVALLVTLLSLASLLVLRGTWS